MGAVKLTMWNPRCMDHFRLGDLMLVCGFRVQHYGGEFGLTSSKGCFYVSLVEGANAGLHRRERARNGYFTEERFNALRDYARSHGWTAGAQGAGGGGNNGKVGGKRVHAPTTPIAGLRGALLAAREGGLARVSTYAQVANVQKEAPRPGRWNAHMVLRLVDGGGCSVQLLWSKGSTDTWDQWKDLGSAGDPVWWFFTDVSVKAPPYGDVLLLSTVDSGCKRVDQPPATYLTHAVSPLPATAMQLNGGGGFQTIDARVRVLAVEFFRRDPLLTPSPSEARLLLRVAARADGDGDGKVSTCSPSVADMRKIVFPGCEICSEPFVLDGNVLVHPSDSCPGYGEFQWNTAFFMFSSVLV